MFRSFDERGETKDLNMIATIGYGHMCLREEKQRA
jgi:hypothetical protein